MQYLNKLSSRNTSFTKIQNRELTLGGDKVTCRPLIYLIFRQKIDYIRYKQENILTMSLLENIEQQLKKVCQQQEMLDTLIRNHNDNNALLGMLFDQSIECIKISGNLIQ